MTPEEILKNSGNQKFEVNIGVSLLRIIEITNRNQEFLREILKEQLVLKEMIKGKTEPLLGWYSDSFMQKKPTNVVFLNKKTKSSINIVTKIKVLEY